MAEFLRAHPDHDARYRAAFRAREAGPNARGIAAPYSDREMFRAAADLMMTHTRHVSISRVSPLGPLTKTVMKARSRSAELQAAIDHAEMTRRARLQIKNGPRFNPTTPGLIAESPKSKPPVQSGERLASSLSSNDIWRLAAAALPNSLDRNTRDDVIADIAIEVLEGRLAPNLIAKRASEFLRAHNRKFSTLSTRSLDASLGSDSGFALIDTVSTGWD